MNFEINTYLPIIINFLAVLITTIVVGFAFRKVLLRRLLKLAEKSKFKFDDLVVEALGVFNVFFDIVLAIYISNQILDFPEAITSFINIASPFVIVFYLAVVFVKISTYLLRLVFENTLPSDEPVDPVVFNFADIAFKVLIWILALVFVLQNIGLNVTGLVGGLGLAGIAIGLAVQNLLEDVFSFFSIYFDKPFKRGDFVSINGQSGKVTDVSVKSTRIQTLSGEELVVPNKEITSAMIDNFAEMETRRISFNVGVEYEVPPEQLKQIPKMIEKIISDLHKDVEFKRAHLNIFGDSALIYEVVYVLQDSSYEFYMDMHQKIMFKIIDEFATKNISLAYPTQRLILENSN